MERSVLKWSVEDDIVSSYAEEWRFHASWSLAAQTKCRWNAWSNCWRARFGFKPEDTNGSFRSHHFYRKQWTTTGFKMVCLYLLKIFSTICDPILASVLPLKAMVSCISRTCDFEPKISGKKCGLYTSKYGNCRKCFFWQDTHNSLSIE